MVVEYLIVYVCTSHFIYSLILPIINNMYLALYHLIMTEKLLTGKKLLTRTLKHQNKQNFGRQPLKMQNRQFYTYCSKMYWIIHHNEKGTLKYDCQGTAHLIMASFIEDLT